jgi:MFS family permease
MLDTAEASLRRDVRVIGLVGSAHFFSHFFQLVLPPLFPILKDELGVPYVALGLLMGVLFAASGIGQTVSGFLVDRWGAARVLLVGMAMLAGSIAAIGLTHSYGALLGVAVLAGLGNSVFHPADYSIFNASVNARRLGRAYSVHGICGNLGWMVAPAVVVGLTGLYGWRAALMIVGVVGLGAVALLASQSHLLADGGGRGAARAMRRPRSLADDLRLLTAAPILAAFGYFTLLAISLIGMQTFSVAALMAIYHVPLGLATGALTAMFLGSALGVLAGGFLADRTSRHHLVAAGGMTAGAVLALVLASAVPPAALLPVVMALAGFFLGSTSPSRDMLVRSATPPGASGKVYGFVYSGLDLGSSLTPLAFGWLLDHGEPRAVFVMAAVFMLLTIGTVVQVRRHGVPAVARA